jgi:hypothetical protein
MANDYDNTDRGAAFAPFATQKMILQGKLNDAGNDRKIVLVKDETKNGKVIIEVFEKVGVLFENDKKGNEAAPDYTGNLQSYAGERRIASWKKMKDDKPYMTLNVSDKQAGAAPQQQAPAQQIADDDIPW